MLPETEAAKSVTTTPRRPEQRADHAEHLHVAQAHALLARDLLVEKREQEEPSRPERRRRAAACSGVRRTETNDEREPDGDPGQRDRVGQDLEVVVDREQREARPSRGTRPVARSPQDGAARQTQHPEDAVARARASGTGRRSARGRSGSGRASTIHESDGNVVVRARPACRRTGSASAGTRSTRRAGAGG